jgi:His-Xaa-Ser system protein HxsD
MDLQVPLSSDAMFDPFASGVYIDVDMTLYPRPVLFRTCYVYTDRCYIFLTPLADTIVRVRFRPRPGLPLEAVVGSFCNELIEQEIRFTLASESREIRDLIVAQAFAEADFRDPHGTDIPR